MWRLFAALPDVPFAFNNITAKITNDMKWHRYKKQPIWYGISVLAFEKNGVGNQEVAHTCPQALDL